MHGRLRQMRTMVLARYLGASVIALGCDMGAFLVLLAAGLDPAAAAALGYALGIAAHWLVSSRKVFAASVAPRGPARTRQKALFVGSALIGLAVTTAVVSAASQLGIDPRLGKLGAVAASFTITWLLRNALVFRQAAPA